MSHRADSAFRRSDSGMKNPADNKIIEVPLLMEMVVLCHLPMVTKRANLRTHAVLPTRMLKVGKQNIAVDWVVHEKVIDSPVSQSIEAHIRHHAQLAVAEWEQAWRKKWDYCGRYAVELIIGDIGSGARDTDNLAKILLDALQGEGGIFAQDSEVQVLLVDRRGGGNSEFYFENNERITPSIARVFRLEHYQLILAGECPWQNAVVVKNRDSDYSKSKEMGLHIWSSVDQMEKTIERKILEIQKRKG